MNKRMFSELSLETKRAKLFSVIKQKAGEFFTDEEIKDIIKKLDLSKQFTVKVVNDPFEFNSLAKEYYVHDEHSWAGESKFTSNVDVLFAEDDFKSGMVDSYVFYRNGNEETSSREERDAEFNVDARYVIAVYEHDYDGYDGKNLHTYTNKLVIYIPKEVLINEVISEFIAD